MTTNDIDEKRPISMLYRCWNLVCIYRNHKKSITDTKLLLKIPVRLTSSIKNGLINNKSIHDWLLENDDNLRLSYTTKVDKITISIDIK